MKQNLILVIGVTLILLINLNVVSANWFTGKAISSNTIYTIYQGKSKNVELGENTYKISVKVVSSSSRALLNIDGIQHEVTTGINQIGNLEVNVDLISPKKSLKKAFVKFSVSEIESEVEGYEVSEEESQRYDEFVALYKPADKPPIYSITELSSGQIFDTKVKEVFVILKRKFSGSSWDCYEEVVKAYGGEWKSVKAYTEPKTIGAGLPTEISENLPSDARKTGYKCVYIEQYPKTGKPEFIVVSEKNLDYVSVKIGQDSYYISYINEGDEFPNFFISGQDTIKTKSNSYFKAE